MTQASKQLAALIKADPGLAAIADEEQLKWDISMVVLELRERSGLNQTEFAKRVGKSRSTIARIEKGSFDPSIETLREMASALDKQLVIRFEDKQLK